MNITKGDDKITAELNACNQGNSAEDVLHTASWELRLWNNNNNNIKKKKNEQPRIRWCVGGKKRSEKITNRLV